MIITILIFIVVLGFLVFVHELGHFLVAKWSGMMPEEFGFGFPPRMVGLQKIDGKWKVVGSGQTNPDKTVYSINWIPFGAFVRIRGENGEDTDQKSFASKSWIRRFLTLFAGVGMNIVAAWALFSIGLVSGLPADADTVPKGASISNVQVILSNVAADSPADLAGLQSGDAVAAINGEIIREIDQVKEKVIADKGTEMELTVIRSGDLRIIKVTPDAEPKEGRGALGVELALVGTLRYPFYIAPFVAIKVTFIQLWAIVQGLGQLVSGGVGFADVAGPAKIAQITGQAAELGFGYLLQFSAFLSLNLAVLNVLPIPALDGGRILFLIIEKLRGKKNNQTVEQWVHAIGFLVLLLLVGIVTVNDLRSFEFVKNIFN